MFRRPLRNICLVVAIWAVLFAPGALQADTGTTDAGAPEDAGRVAAAVIAPTFTADGLVAARSDGTSGLADADADLPVGSVPPVAALVTAIGFSTALHRSSTNQPQLTLLRSDPSRAPPAS